MTFLKPASLIGAFALAIGGACGQIILSEVYYDAPAGDDDREWVELYNTGSSQVNLTGWSLAIAGSSYQGVIDLSGNIDPGRTFVVGGPRSEEENAHPFVNLPIDLNPDLGNSGNIADAVALFNVRSAMIMPTTVPVDAVIYGDENSDGIIDETGSVGAIDVADAASGQSIARISEAGEWRVQPTPNPNITSFAGPPPVLVLSEVFYDPEGTDGGLEWVEIFNAGNLAINLNGWSLGAGGLSYKGIVNLSGVIEPGDTMVIGGPVSDARNGNPVFDIAIEFDADLQNSGITADGVALFDVSAGFITESTLPIDTVIYGRRNTNELINPTGAVGDVDVDDASSGESIARIDLQGTWVVQSLPTPGFAAF